MQDNIATLPTSSDQPNQGDVDLIKSICGVNGGGEVGTISITMLLYATIICFIVSSQQIEDILTRYLSLHVIQHYY